MSWRPQSKIVGIVKDLLYTERGQSEPTKTDKLSCDPGGVVHESHAGMQTLSTVREKAIVEKGSYVLNLRQLSLTCLEECEIIAANLGLADILPEDLLSNIHLEHVGLLSTMPPGSFIQFYDKLRQRRQLVVMITSVNQPCEIARGRVEARLGRGMASGFEKAAYNRRGVVAMVYHPGFVKIGDRVEITTPSLFIS